MLKYHRNRLAQRFMATGVAIEVMEDRFVITKDAVENVTEY